MLLLLLPIAGHAQGFAGLGTPADDAFSEPEQGRKFDFPADHGPHPEFRIEWWYVTANLQSSDGTAYGVQWTLFRSALSPGQTEGWQSPQIWMGHAGLTTPDRHFVAETLARDGVGQAGVLIEPFSAWIDNWEMLSIADTDVDPLSGLSLAAYGQDFSYALQLNATGTLVLQGQDGYSIKSANGQSSHYYSQPFYEVTGEIVLPDGPVQVTGQAWLDREWSSQPLDDDQSGWDWFSLHFDEGEKFMAFRLRSEDADASYLSGTWIASDGSPVPLAPDDLTIAPDLVAQVEGRQIPIEWRIQVPAQGIDVSIRALNPQSWMATLFPYWEGPIRFEGSHTGQGYLEMTGYD